MSMSFTTLAIDNGNVDYEKWTASARRRERNRRNKRNYKRITA